MVFESLARSIELRFSFRGSRRVVPIPGSDRPRAGRAAASLPVVLAVSGAILGLGAAQQVEGRESQGEPGGSEESAAAQAEAPATQNRAGMVRIRGGAFWYGCNERVDSECDDDEKPGRRITSPEFWIDRTEVTVAAYRGCVVAGSCRAGGLKMPFWKQEERPAWAWACNWGKLDRQDHPMNCVTWDHARSYCEWVEKRLPTEQEWERAARGSDGLKYPWGNSDYGQDGLVANIADETLGREKPRWPKAEGYDDGFYVTAPVGSFPLGSSPEGALDLVGNVWEWTSNWFSSNQKYRVARGGSWANAPRLTRASNRYAFDPEYRGETFGFRCAH